LRLWFETLKKKVKKLLCGAVERKVKVNILGDVKQEIKEKSKMQGIPKPSKAKFSEFWIGCLVNLPVS
jgi:hypothetical protein